MSEKKGHAFGINLWNKWLAKTVFAQLFCVTRVNICKIM